MKKVLACFLFLILLCAGAAAPAEAPVPAAKATVHQINIGCADAYMLLSGETVILVDCGTNTHQDNHNDALLNYLARSGIDHVDVHFVTHYHDDHALNINVLNELYGTDSSIVYGPSPELSPRFTPLAKGRYQQLTDGEELDIGPFHVKCLSPANPNNDGNTNYDSLNLLVTFGESTFVFTGDWVDKSVAIRHPEVMEQRLDVLSFPHHGLQRSYFLWCLPIPMYKQWDPRIVLVPGKEGPQIEYLARWNHLSEDIQVYCTTDGNIVVESDGHSVTAHTHAEPEDFGYGK